jgi:hypothetical protein
MRLSGAAANRVELQRLVIFSSVGFPAMTYPQNNGRILNDGINNPVISDSKFPQSGEFSFQRGESLCLVRKVFLYFFQDPFSLFLSYLLQVASK